MLFLLCLLEANEVGGRAEEEVVDVVVSGLLAAALATAGGAG